MKPLAIISFALGAIVAAALIAHFGVTAVLHALGTMSWLGFGIILCCHLCLVLLMGSAWWLLGENRPDGKWHRFVWGRLVRDGASEILPFSQIGGFVAGARAMTVGGVKGSFAAASSVVDLTAEMMAQLAYTALGLGLLIWLEPNSGLAGPISLGLAGMTVLSMAFLLVQARGAGLVERIGLKLAGQWIGATLSKSSAVQEEIHLIHDRRRRLAGSVLLHLTCWVLSGLEAWLMLRFMGVAIPIAAALAIDSLICGVRSFAFMVPNAVGVQETAFVLLGSLFGITPDVALALSLVRRGRDIVIGTPALLCWQWLESSKIIRKVA